MAAILERNVPVFTEKSSKYFDKLGSDGSDHLIISPYIDPPHLLDLTTVGLQEQILAQALSQLTLLRSDYATAPYIETFNWQEVIASVRSRARAADHRWRNQSFYVVVFRSQIPATTDRSHLGDLDKAAHAEAVASGGFLKYWFGIPDSEGRNLATCVWRSKEDARLGGIGEAHRLAAKSARDLYTEWRIERLALVIDDEVVKWSIEPWID